MTEVYNLPDLFARVTRLERFILDHHGPGALPVLKLTGDADITTPVPTADQLRRAIEDKEPKRTTFETIPERPTVGTVASIEEVAEEVPPQVFVYRNHRGVIETRRVTPIKVWYGNTEWHPEHQWFLKAHCHKHGAERDFAFDDIQGSHVAVPYVKAIEPYAAALRMIREAVEELFGPIASLESECAVLLRGPEPHHDAEAIIAALQRVNDYINHEFGRVLAEITERVDNVEVRERIYASDPFDALVMRAKAVAISAMNKYPQPNYVLLKVAEEAGEVVKAGVHYAEGRGSWEHVEVEVIDTIAMLFRLITEGDGTIGLYPPTDEVHEKGSDEDV